MQDRVRRRGAGLDAEPNRREVAGRLRGVAERQRHATHQCEPEVGDAGRLARRRRTVAAVLEAQIRGVDPGVAAVGVGERGAGVQATAR